MKHKDWQEHVKTHYICKYTPIELICAYGGDAACINTMPEDTEEADQYVGPNICGFGKALVESSFNGDFHELVVANCCDTIRSVGDVLEAFGPLDFLYTLDIPHSDRACMVEAFSEELKRFAQAYGRYMGTEFDEARFRAAFKEPEKKTGPYIAVLGARMGDELFAEVEKLMPLPVRNGTCLHNRSVGEVPPPENLDFDGLMYWYAEELLGQMPCMRMMNTASRRKLLEDPDLQGIIYHTVKFCDFYSFEYSELTKVSSTPLVKIESDFTTQSAGQLRTRLEAFAEELEDRLDLRSQAGNLKAQVDTNNEKDSGMKKNYFAGIDSGSTSTDVVIVDADGAILARSIIATGYGASVSAEKALEQALVEANLAPDDIANMVATGYGRSVISQGSGNVTEISCHARGARALDPQVRTIIDIGGQDSKVILIDEDGKVLNFAMNDKCAAGTGRFLEMMAHTLQLDLSAMSKRGLKYDEDIKISSTCSVFAESEVVSLIAQNKAVDDIVHGLNKSVAAKTYSLVRRVKGRGPYMMTGGVSRNDGLVKTLEEVLGEKLIISKDAQLCGALGAALYARDLSLGRR